VFIGGLVNLKNCDHVAGGWVSWANRVLIALVTVSTFKNEQNENNVERGSISHQVLSTRLASDKMESLEDGTETINKMLLATAMNRDASHLGFSQYH
jgi:hypothetical protein